MAAWSVTDVTTGVDLTVECDASATSIAQRAYAETSRFSTKVVDESATISILTEHEILVMDGAVKAFAGYVRTRRRTDQGSSSQRVYEIEAQDYTTALGDDVIDSASGVRTTETDKARITALFTAFGTRGIVIGASVVQLRATMPDFDYTGMTLHEALTAICVVTGGSFYVDFDKILHYFNTEALSAPFALSDAPNGTSSFGYEQFSLADDSAQFVNAVYVIGTGVTDWRPSAAAVATLRAAGTLRAMVIRDETITDASTLNAAGDAALALYGSTRQPSSLVTYRPGLKAGQNVQLTHAGWSISAVTYRIASVEARPVDANRIAYTIFFGSNPITLGELMRQTNMSVAATVAAAAEAQAAVTDLSAAGGNLIPNSSFEDGTYWTVGASWAIGVSVADAFVGAKEARYTPSASSATLQTGFIPVARSDTYFASAWIYCRAFTSGRLRMLVAEYNAAGTQLAETIVGEVAATTSGWIRVDRAFKPAAALGATVWQPTTAKILIQFNPNGVNATGTWSVDGVQLERGGMLTAYAPAPYELVDGSITGTKIAALTIALGNLAALSVDSTKITTGAITTPKLATNSVTANEIAALTITAAEIGANAVTTVKLNALAVDATKIAANAIVAGKIAAGIITATELASGAVTTSKLAVGAVIGSVDNSTHSVIIDSTGIAITNGALTIVDQFGSNVMTGGGFGEAWSSFIRQGLYNGDFRISPANATELNDTTNPLAYWKYVRLSGTSVVGKSTVAGQVSFVEASGAGSTTDEAYIEQLVKVPAAGGVNWLPGAGFRVVAEVDTGAAPFTYLSAAYVAADGVTLVGTVDEDARIGGAFSLRALLGALPNGDGEVPSTARYLRIRLGMRRDVYTGPNTAVIHAVWVVPFTPGLGSQPALTVKATAVQSIPNATATTLLLPTTVDSAYPNDSIFRSMQGPTPYSKIIIPPGFRGRWRFEAHVGFASVVANAWVALDLNGGGNHLALQSTDRYASVVATADCIPGDFVEIVVLQASGAAVNTSVAAYSPFLTAEFIGPSERSVRR